MSLRRGLAMRRGFGDGAQVIDHLCAPGVVLQRVEGAVDLFGCQRIAAVGGCGGCVGRGAGLCQSRAGEQRADEQDRGRKLAQALVRHECPFLKCARRQGRLKCARRQGRLKCARRQGRIRYCLRASVMSDRPFSPLSCVGSLLVRRLCLGIYSCVFSVTNYGRSASARVRWPRWSRRLVQN